LIRKLRYRNSNRYAHQKEKIEENCEIRSRFASLVYFSCKRYGCFPSIGSGAGTREISFFLLLQSSSKFLFLLLPRNLDWLLRMLQLSPIVLVLS
jgi:hypothetical protein